jgi:hypothetical protein
MFPFPLLKNSHFLATKKTKGLANYILATISFHIFY